MSRLRQIVTAVGLVIDIVGSVALWKFFDVQFKSLLAIHVVLVVAIVIVGWLFYGAYARIADRRDAAESELERAARSTATLPRRLNASGITDSLAAPLRGFPHLTYRFQVFAPYGDKEAFQFATDIDGILRGLSWDARGEIERQLYEGAPVEGVIIWSSSDTRVWAERLVAFLRAYGVAAQHADRDDYALGLTEVVEIHVREQ